MLNVEHAKLRIKENSLAAEQTMIRREEKKHKWAARAARGRQRVLKAEAEAKRQGFVERDFTTNTNSLREHRLGLRKELRSTHLARCFLRGTLYGEAERFAYTQPDWNRIQSLITRYSGEEPAVVSQRYAEWLQEGLRGVMPYVTDGHFGSDNRNPTSKSTGDRAWIEAQGGE